MVCAVVGCIRVGLLTATVSTLADSENVVSQTTQLRSQSADLQVKESSLSNPTTIKQTASTSLGMSAPEETTKITLGTDVVSVDDSGSLSLSQSLAAASR
jgi:cell division protein FtsL